MCSNWQGDQGIESDKDNKHEKIAVIPLKQLKDFKNHPFKVELNTELFELMQSIEKEGVLVPLLARPNPDGEGYEIVAGHRRKAACEWAGITEITNAYSGYLMWFYLWIALWSYAGVYTSTINKSH